MTENTDHAYLARALLLAEQGRYTVAPNPMVACLLVKNNRILAEGIHQQAGEPHAEILALSKAGAAARGATAYLNLEPCCHEGRTPPCTQALIKAGIKTVYFSCLDPNPLVAGQGMRALKAAGIEVFMGLLEKEATALNAIFFHYIQKKRPFVIAKWALSLDGHTKTQAGDSRHISNESAKVHAHDLRRQVSAILVGSKTARLDNPRLTARNLAGHDLSAQPLRLILTSRGDLPLDLQVFKSDLAEKTWVITTEHSDLVWRSALTAKGVFVLVLKATREGKVDLQAMLNELGRREISSLLVEGGRTLHEAFLAENLINKVQVYLAPTLIGSLPEKKWLKALSCETLGQDFSFSAYL